MRTEIESPEHEAELTQLAIDGNYEYGIKGNYFFVRVIINETTEEEQ